MITSQFYIVLFLKIKIIMKIFLIFNSTNTININIFNIIIFDINISEISIFSINNLNINIFDF